MVNKINTKYNIIFGIMMLILMFFTVKHFYYKRVFSSSSFLAGFIVFTILAIITIFILKYFNGKDIAKQFLVIGLIWGSAFTFINPPFMVPDEYVHIIRSYDLSKGRILYKAHEDSMKLPIGLYKYDQKVWGREQGVGVVPYIKDIFTTPLEKENLATYNAAPTGGYSTIAYIPQSVGFFIGDLLNLNPYFVVTLGRLTNLLTWLTICYFALKIMPIKKELLFLLMCIPVGIQQAASASPDALLNSSSFLLISYILYLKFKKENIQRKDLAIIVLLTIIIGSIKLPYIVIAGLVLVIPKEKFKFKVLGKVLIILLVGVINIGFLMGWRVLSKPAEVPQTSIETQTEKKEKPKENHLIEAAKNPVLFMKKVAKSLVERMEFYKSSFTANFGWFRVLAPTKFINLVLIMLFLFAIKADGDNSYKLSFYDKGIFFMLVSGLYLILCLTAFMWYKRPLVEVELFDGIQGRYFYPFIIGLFLLFQNTKAKINFSQKAIDSFRNIYLTYTLAFSLLLIYTQYFILNW